MSIKTTKNLVNYLNDLTIESFCTLIDDNTIEIKDKIWSVDEYLNQCSDIEQSRFNAYNNAYSANFIQTSNTTAIESGNIDIFILRKLLQAERLDYIITENEQIDKILKRYKKATCITINPTNLPNPFEINSNVFINVDVTNKNEILNNLAASNCKIFLVDSDITTLNI